MSLLARLERETARANHNALLAEQAQERVRRAEGAEAERARIIELVEARRVDDRDDSLSLHLAKQRHNEVLDDILAAIKGSDDADKR